MTLDTAWIDAEREARRRGGTPVVTSDLLDVAGKSTDSVDPGSRNLLSCLSHSEDGVEASWADSTKDWKHRMRIERAQAYR